MAWVSSGSTIGDGLEFPVGCFDKVSGALFLTPGMWTIRKLYLSFLFQVPKSGVADVPVSKEWLVVHCDSEVFAAKYEVFCLVGDG